MESIPYSSKRNYENALGPITTEQDAKRISVGTALQSLLDTKNLAELAQAMDALSQQGDGSTYPPDDRIALLGDHLQGILNQTSVDQLHDPGCAIHLQTIIGSLGSFQSWDLSSLFFFIANLMSSESAPYLSPEAIGNLFAHLWSNKANMESREALVKASVRHIEHSDHLSPETILQIFNAVDHFFFFSLSCSAVLNALVPHISRAEPFDCRMIKWSLSPSDRDRYERTLRPRPYETDSAKCPGLRAVLGALANNLLCSKKLGPLEINKVVDCVFRISGCPDAETILYKLASAISCVREWHMNEFKIICNIFDTLIPGGILQPIHQEAIIAVLKAFATSITKHEQFNLALDTRAFHEKPCKAGTDAVARALSLFIQNHNLLDVDEICQVIEDSRSILGAEVAQAILEALELHIKNREPLDASEIIRVLQGCHSRYPWKYGVAQSIARALAPHIEKNDQFSLDELLTILQLWEKILLMCDSGLVKLIQSDKEVKEISEALALNIKNRELLDASEIIRVLQGCHSHGVAQSIARALAPHIEKNDQFSLDELLTILQLFVQIETDMGLPATKALSLSIQNHNLLDVDDICQVLAKSALIRSAEEMELILESLALHIKNREPLDCSEIVKILKACDFRPRRYKAFLPIARALAPHIEKNDQFSLDELHTILKLFVQIETDMGLPASKALSLYIQNHNLLDMDDICRILRAASYITSAEELESIVESLALHIKNSEPLDVDEIVEILEACDFRPHPYKAFLPIARALAPHIEKNDQFSLNQICRILRRRSQITGDMGLRAAILEGLSLSIQNHNLLDVDDICRILSDSAFYTSYAEELESILESLALHIKNSEPLDVDEIVEILEACDFPQYRYKEFPIARALASHIENHPEISSDQLDEILCYLINFDSTRQKSEASPDVIMKALVPHICRSRLSKGVILRVYGRLEYLSSSDKEVVLDALCKQIDSEMIKSAFPDEEAGRKQQRKKFISLAKIVHILIFGLQQGSNTAATLLKTVVSNMGPNENGPLNEEGIDSLDQQRRMVIRLLENPEQPDKINLYDIPVFLAEFYLQAVFGDLHSQQRSATTLPQLGVQYGKLGSVLQSKALSRPIVINYSSDLYLTVRATILNEENFKRGNWLILISDGLIFIDPCKKPTEFSPWGFKHAEVAYQSEDAERLLD